MPREIPELEAFRAAEKAVKTILAEATSLTAIVLNGAKMLEGHVATWRFGIQSASEPDTDDRIRIDLDHANDPIDPGTWPHVGRFMDLQQRYHRAVDAENAAFAALPDSLKPLVRPKAQHPRRR